MGCNLDKLQQLPRALSHADASIQLASPIDHDAAPAVQALLRSLEDSDDGRASHALAAVVATRDETRWLYVTGMLSLRSRRTAKPDTPFYLASLTKSYVGLLAARLHLEGVLPLQLSLDDVWPGLTLPKLQARKVTMLHLLTHQLPLTNDELTQRTSYEQGVAAADYPALLSGSQPRSPGFRYDNLGYLVYAAALETVTGIGWKAWLEQKIILPLNFARTSPRSSDFPTRELARRHVRAEGRWHSRPPKPDALMHAAGGLYSSPTDLAKWIQAHLSCGTVDLPAETFNCARRAYVQAKSVDGPFRWSGYGLGLQLGTIADLDIIGCRGGYAGARSLIVIAVTAGAGLALLVNADFGTRGLLDRLASAFFTELAETSRKLSPFRTDAPQKKQRQS